MAPSPVLDLTTERQRPFVRINGRTFDFRDHLDLSIFDSRLLRKWGERLEQLEALDEPTEAQRTEYTDLLRRVSRYAFVDQELVEPALAPLNEPQLKAIVQAFTTLLLPRLQQTRAQMTEAGSPRPSAKPSRGSSASTASRRRRGSGTSR